MKHQYIESLLSEIQQLESKVANLKENKSVSFSFFKESFKRTQEISRLLHELEFVQIEDMKAQMEKLMQFLSESESAKAEAKTETETSPIISVPNIDKTNSEKEEQIVSKTEVATPDIELSENKEEKDEIVSIPKHSYEVTDAPRQQSIPPATPLINNQKETIVDHLSPKNKSLNDIQPINHTLLDTKRSISLNDRFLFQRELFDNNREAMNDMLTKLQSFSTFDATENYLKENTDWNFKDETVDKFVQMLKESFR